jgi:hypothetical protein
MTIFYQDIVKAAETPGFTVEATYVAYNLHWTVNRETVKWAARSRDEFEAISAFAPGAKPGYTLGGWVRVIPETEMREGDHRVEIKEFEDCVFFPPYED